MLVVTANWAIADGSAHGGPSQRAVRAFFGELRRAAWRAGFRRDGRYCPVESIHIVLAGDTFDGLTSLRWRGDLRPWQGGSRRESAAEQIAADAARCGGRFLAGLGRLQRHGLAVPRADSRGRPLAHSTCQATVRVVCLVGDRDRVLDGRWFAAIAGRHGIPIGTEWSSDTMLIRHGAECDPLCGPPDLPAWGRGPTLAESIVVDLLVDFARRLHGAALPPATVAAVTRPLATAPLLELPHQIRGSRLTADRGHPCDEHEPTVCEAWKRSVQHWHTQAHATMPEAAVEHDVVDAVATWMEAGSDPDRRPPSRGLAAVLENLRPRPLRRSTDPRLLVLGHPPDEAGDGAGMPGRAGLFLGPTACPSREPGENPGDPAAVAFPVVGSRHGQWLTGSRRGFAAGRAVHVAHSGAMNDGLEVIDAA